MALIADWGAALYALRQNPHGGKLAGSSAVRRRRLNFSDIRTGCGELRSERSSLTSAGSSESQLRVSCPPQRRRADKRSESVSFDQCRIPQVRRRRGLDQQPLGPLLAQVPNELLCLAVAAPARMRVSLNRSAAIAIRRSLAADPSQPPFAPSALDPRHDDQGSACRPLRRKPWRCAKQLRA